MDSDVDIEEGLLLEFRQKIKNLSLMDDRFMSAFFNDFKEGAQLVLRIILDKPDLTVINVVSQYSLSSLYGRSLRIDVFAKDSEGVHYNIEIQRAAAGAGVKRARYHSSLLDANISKPGEDCEELPKTYVIFITEKDVWGDGRSLHSFRRYDDETGELFEDGTVIIYVNGTNKDNSTALGRLMQDFFNPDPKSMNYKELSDKADFMKNKREGLTMTREFLTEEEWDAAIAQGIQTGRKQGLAQGKAQGLVQGKEQGVAMEKNLIVRRLISSGKISAEDISVVAQIPVEEVRRIEKESVK